VLRTASAIIALGLAVAACADAEAIESDEPTAIGRTAEALDADATVTDAVAQSCSTTAVKGLATQLVEEIQCLRPGTMTRIDNIEGLNLGEAVFPYLQTPAAEALTTAQKVRDVPIAINSGLRTLPQQFLLYRWYKTGRCGIGLAATPGTSNHESAIAVDVQDNAAWRSALQGKGFRWLGSSDPVHYDFTGKGAVESSAQAATARPRATRAEPVRSTSAYIAGAGPTFRARATRVVLRSCGRARAPSKPIGRIGADPLAAR
jgi:hypothetical protein